MNLMQMWSDFVSAPDLYDKEPTKSGPTSYATYLLPIGKKKYSLGTGTINTNVPR